MYTITYTNGTYSRTSKSTSLRDVLTTVKNLRALGYIAQFTPVNPKHSK